MTKLKKILSVVASAAMAISMIVASASAATTARTVNVTVKGAPSDWAKVTLYSWGDTTQMNGKSFDPFPGIAMTKQADGTYTAQVKSKDATGITLIFGNGIGDENKAKKVQTENLVLKAPGCTNVLITLSDITTGKNAMSGEMQTQVKAVIAVNKDAAKPAGSETATTAASDAAAAKTESPKTGSTAAPIAMASIAALACAAVVVAKKRK